MVRGLLLFCSWTLSVRAVYFVHRKLLRIAFISLHPLCSAASTFECDLGTTFVMNPGQASLDISIQNTEAILGDILENGRIRDIWTESRYHLPPLSLSSRLKGEISWCMHFIFIRVTPSVHQIGPCRTSQSRLARFSAQSECITLGKVPHEVPG